MTVPLLVLRGLGVRYANAVRPALEGVSLDILPSERVAAIGESGSGKSSLALAIAGLLPPGAVQSGAIEWPGFPAAPKAGRDIGLVFQDAGASLDPVMPVGRQVAEVLHTHSGFGWREAEAEAVELLARVRLPNPPAAAKTYAHQLSGGQRQRVAIAAAIAARPALLIADEATSALDTVVQAEIVRLLLELCRAENMALFFVTHDIALASQIADRIAVLDDGRLAEWGSAAEVISRPQHARTQALLAAHLTLDAPA